MTQDDLVAALDPVAKALEELGVPWHIGGSVASSTFGIPRTTMDVDLVADLRHEQAMPLCRLLAGRFYAEPELVRMAIDASSSVNFIHLGTAFKVDVFAVKKTSYDTAAFRRQRLDRIEGIERPLPFATPEDIVLHKLRWFRSGGEVSERQWLDVLGVLKIQRGQLALDYMSHWAGEIGVADLLATALREAGS